MDPNDLGAALATMRAIRRASRGEVALAAGVQPRFIPDYENGKISPNRGTRESLAAALRVSPEFLGSLAVLLPALGLAADAGSLPLGLVRGMLDFSREAEALLAPPPPGTSGELPAQALWERFRSYAPAERRAVVSEIEELRSSDLALLLCEESVSVAADDAANGLEIARLALFVAERVPGSDDWRWRLTGYVWAFVGNAHRVCGELLAAEAAFQRSDELLRKGAADAGSLSEVRLFELKASLLCAQRQFPEALLLLDQAIVADQADVSKGRLLILRAKTLEELGDYEEAVATLRRALPLVDGERDPRLALVAHFNLVETLQLLGGHTEVEERLPAVRELTVQLGNQLDLVRLRWVEARVDAARGRTAEALAGFREVRDAFIAREIAYDTALVTLELAVLLLDLGQTAEVRALVPEMAWIFESQGVKREFAATLRLFVEAVEREAMTVDLAQRLLAELRGAA